MKTLIITHKNCKDALFAVQSAKTAIPDAQVVYLNNRVLQPQAKIEFFEEVKKRVDISELSEIIVLDISLPFNFIEETLTLNSKVKVSTLDHHESNLKAFQSFHLQVAQFPKTASAMASRQVSYVFNNFYATCELAYLKYVKDKDVSQLWKEKPFEVRKQLPLAILYLADADLNMYRYKESRAFEKAVNAKVKNVTEANKMFPLVLKDKKAVMSYEKNVKRAIMFGQSILDFTEAEMNKLAFSAKEIGFNLNGNALKGYIVNASIVFRNELAQKLLEKDEDSSIAMIWSQDAEGRVTVFVRSEKENELSDFIKHYGVYGTKTYATITFESLAQFATEQEKWFAKTMSY